MTTNGLVSATVPNHIGNTPSFGPLIGAGPYDFTTETFVEVALNAGATFSYMSVFWSAPALQSLTFHKNTAAGNQVISSNTVSAALYSDTTHSDACSAADLVNYGFTSTNFGSFFFTSNTMNSANPYYITGAGYPSTSGSGTFTFPTVAGFGSLFGGITPTVTPSSKDSQQTLEAVGTASKFSINITAAPTGTATINLETNGSIGNQVISTTGVTGVVTDSTHSDAFTAGIAVDTKIVSTTAVGTFKQISLSVANTTSAQDLIGSTNPGNSVTAQFFLSWGAISNALTAAQAGVPVSYGATASLVRLTSNQSTSNTGNVTAYVNGAPGNGVASYVGTAGVIVDVTHTDSVVATNTCCLQVNHPSTTWSLASAGLTLNDGSFGGAKFPSLSLTGSGP